eukprot:3188824-Pyramimonas_sp.AAC.1
MPRSLQLLGNAFKLSQLRVESNKGAPPQCTSSPSPSTPCSDGLITALLPPSPSPSRVPTISFSV